MILNKFFPYHEVRASHIWKYSTSAGLGDFGLNESDLTSTRNRMLMCISIEEAFDVKRLCFLVNRLHPDQIVEKVLDPSLFLYLFAMIIQAHSRILTQSSYNTLKGKCLTAESAIGMPNVLPEAR
jgi:hypothetical protein